MEKKIIYYQDELNDEFSSAKITPIRVDENYPYLHGKLWEFFSFLMQNIFSMPIKYFYAKFKFDIEFIGKEKFKICKDTGYFIYANHTQEFADTFIPSLANYPKRNFFIVNPENVSMKGLKTIVKLLGALPIPQNIKGYHNFINSVEKRIAKKNSVTIYPEAHIWPYYTRIRPFKDVSFQYPVKLNAPIYTVTNTYHKGKKDGKVKIISYIDGPFYPDKGLNKKEAQKLLRDIAYNTMCDRCKKSTYELIEYKRKI